MMTKLHIVPVRIHSVLPTLAAHGHFVLHPNIPKRLSKYFIYMQNLEF